MNEEAAGEVEACASIYGDDWSGPLSAAAARDEAAAASASCAGVSSACAASAPCYSLNVAPEDVGGGGTRAHVAARLLAWLPANYPAFAPAALVVSPVRGLSSAQVAELQALVENGAARAAAEGSPALYTVAEDMRTWLAGHDSPPDDGSAFAEMEARARARAREEVAAAVHSYALSGDPSAGSSRGGGRAAPSAAAEEEAARRRRDGTPVTLESFVAWRAIFERETAVAAAAAASAAVAAAAAAGRASPVDAALLAARPTGKQLFESDETLATSDVAATAAGEAAVVAAAAAPFDSENASGGAFDESLFACDDEDDDYVLGEDDDDDDRNDNDDRHDGDGNDGAAAGSGSRK